MYSDESGAHLAWAATFNGEQDVYYSVITPSYVRIAEQDKDAAITLVHNFPNPFKDKTTISYKLPEKGFISLKVYTLNGREVATIVDETQEAGLHQVVFDASGLDSGVYYYRVQTGKSSQTKRFILLN